MNLITKIKSWFTSATQDLYLEGNIKGHLYCLKEILSSATILPVEESWEKLEENLLKGLHEHTKLEDVISLIIQTELLFNLKNRKIK